jgi:hypothetical protein
VGNVAKRRRIYRADVRLLASQEGLFCLEVGNQSRSQYFDYFLSWEGTNKLSKQFFFSFRINDPCSTSKADVDNDNNHFLLVRKVDTFRCSESLFHKFQVSGIELNS